MRLIDADALYEKTAEWEAQALAYVERLEPTEDHEKWVKWTAILNERTAFKHDVADAPTIDVEPVKHGHWVGVDDEPCNVWECDVCGWIYEDDEPYYNFCPHCGAKMEESNEQDI